MHFAGKEIVMKIERVNENQIRCTLNKDDLASRQLKISELAYGSDKAKELFRDMMQQASYEVGFDAEDIPLMIEAIPVSADCIVLIVTKVENPEELDTRFSKFSPGDDGEYDYDDEYSDMETIDESSSYDESSVPPTAGDELDIDSEQDGSDGGVIGDDLMSLFSKVRDYLNSNAGASKAKNSATGNSVKADNSLTQEGTADSSDTDISKKTVKTSIYSFESMDDFTAAARAVSPIYNDTNSLYKKPDSDRYYLLLKKEGCSSVNFNKVCNILSEYAAKEAFTEDSAAYFDEHGELIIGRHAIRIGATL